MGQVVVAAAWADDLNDLKVLGGAGCLRRETSL